MMRILIGSACAYTLAAAATASAATFYQRAVVDLSPLTAGTAANDIGTHPSAVAWDGSTAAIAGYNAGATSRDVAIANVSNVLTPTPTFGARYGVQFATAPNGKGYIGADSKAGVGVATAFDGGSSSNTLLRLDDANGAQVFQVAAVGRPISAPAFDTLSTRLSYLIHATHVLRQLDVATGAVASTASTNLSGVTAAMTFRDFDYDAAGNLYARSNNDIVRANRTNATTYNATATMVANLADASVVGQNIAVVEGFPNAAGALFAIYNDRASTADGQPFAGVVKAVRANGAAEPLTFLGADGATPVAFPAAAGLYDFSYDGGTKTLALLDYTNRQLYVFGATPAPEPATLAALAGAALLGLRRRRRR